MCLLLGGVARFLHQGTEITFGIRSDKPFCIKNTDLAQTRGGYCMGKPKSWMRGSNSEESPRYLQKHVKF